MILKVIFILAVVSFLWALWSFRDFKNSRMIKEAKKELAKGRVIFQDKAKEG